MNSIPVLNIYKTHIAESTLERDEFDQDQRIISHTHASPKDIIEKISKYSIPEIMEVIALVKTDLTSYEKVMSVKGGLHITDWTPLNIVKEQDEKLLELLNARFEILKQTIIKDHKKQ